MASHLTITGIDLSPEMLAKAQDKVERKKLGNVVALHEMDAGALAFPDESFDTVVAMYVMTVVPEPERVMRELERVCAAGGEVILVNHFSQDEGFRGLLRAEARAVRRSIGWRPVFELDQVLVCEDLRLAERRALRPFGLFTMLRFVKEPGFGLAPKWPRRASRREVRRGCGAREAARAHQGEDQMAGRAHAWCMAAVCLTPIIGGPYIADCRANWRSSSAG